MRFASLLLVLCLWAFPARSQSVLGKHPADQFLPAFFAQNGNADAIIAGLNAYGTLALSGLSGGGGGVTNIVPATTNGLSGGTLYLNTNFVAPAQIAALGAALTNLATVVSNGVMGQIPSLAGYATLVNVASTNTTTLQTTTNLLGALGTASTNLSLAIGTAGTNNANTISNSLLSALIATNAANLQQTTNLVQAVGSTLTNLATVVSNGVMAQIPSLTGYATLANVAATNTANLQTTTNLLGALGTASTNLSLAIGTAGTNNVNTTSNAIVTALIATNTAALQQTTNLVQAMGSTLTNLATVVSNGVMGQFPGLASYRAITNIVGSYNAGASDCFIISLGTNTAIQFPQYPGAGKEYAIRKVSPVGTLTLTPYAGHRIEGQTNQVLVGQAGSISIVFDGNTNWWIY